jgi:hypothetical protein
LAGLQSQARRVRDLKVSPKAFKAIVPTLGPRQRAKFTAFFIRYEIKSCLRMSGLRQKLISLKK